MRGGFGGAPGRAASEDRRMHRKHKVNPTWVGIPSLAQLCKHRCDSSCGATGCSEGGGTSVMTARAPLRGVGPPG